MQKTTLEILNAFWDTLDFKTKAILAEFAAEMQSAKVKHPDWPVDVIHQAAIVAEESGELVRAALQSTYENADKDHITREAIQTGAMCLRVLVNTQLEFH
ncbi:MAG: hypothetical protein ACJ749_01025 [Flavisolibacter sp.]|jgi:NTP pyrophosphatase (non-canonical NTP hydrolase)